MNGLLDRPRVSVVVEETPGGRAKRRRETLGLSLRQAAEVTNVGRATIAKLENDDPSVDEVSHMRLASAYDRLERRYGLEEPTKIVNVLELPDGTRVVFEGSPEGVAEAAARFLAEREASE